jgi:glycosyltransferase involved in cell wall biosynthesis
MITFAILHCNRLHYLKNCISSIIEFVDLEDSDLLVIDNGSSEAGVDEYLSSLPCDVEIQRFYDRTPNELHRAMNFAIEFSRKHGNRYVNFVQDDYQYLYENPCLIPNVVDTFESMPEAVQLQSHLLWKSKTHRLGEMSLLIAGSARWHLFHSRPPCDNGFTRVALYDKIGPYPENISIHGVESGYISGEYWFMRACRGLKRMTLANPNMGMLMDCCYVRGNQRIGRYDPPPNKYYLKPFDWAKVRQIDEMARQGKVCFIEDWIEPDGWRPDTFKKHSIRKEEITDL